MTVEAAEIYQRHSASVYRHALRLTGNRTEAEDLMQDVFERACRHPERFADASFGGWLHTVTLNTFRDKARRTASLRFFGMTDGAEERIVASGPSPHDVVAAQDFESDVERALAMLPTAFRTAVILSDAQGLSHDEVALMMGTKVSTVRSRVHRGRKMLRALLEHREPQAGRIRFLGPLLSETGFGDPIAALA